MTVQLNDRDLQLCGRVISAGRTVGSVRVVVIKRNGSLLLALPFDRCLARVALSLYEPQRLAGRLLHFALRLMVRLGTHRLLGSIELSVGAGGIGTLIDGGLREIGFVLSAADADARKLVWVHRTNCEYFVGKVGVAKGGDAVAREVFVITELSDKFGQNLPEILVCHKTDGMVAYIMKMIEGSSPKSTEDESVVFEILAKWLRRGARVPLRSIKCWNTLTEYLRKSDDKTCGEFEAISDRSVISPLMHGDLTPWNIKRTKLGETKILDWEHAQLGGVPGWDWLHYQTQKLRLVKRLADDVVYRHIVRMMYRDPLGEYIGRAGFAGYETALLGGYLYYSGRVLGFPREEMIAVWGNDRDSRLDS